MLKTRIILCLPVRPQHFCEDGQSQRFVEAVS
jgi:hypothetical protein